MSAQTLNCPMCGAPASSDAPTCDHCGARLATISCPSCFGMMFLGAKFCSQCGAQAARTPALTESDQNCPRCKENLQPVQIGTSFVKECEHCHGLWVGKSTFEEICLSSEKQAAVLGRAAELSAAKGMTLEEQIRYVPCPECKQLMNRVHFANCSKVIVDVCKAHGTWFDKDELQRIIEFIRGGGLTLSREREIAGLEAKRRRLLETPRGIPETPEPFRMHSATDLGDVVTAAGRILDLLF